jgi:spoIIIJ-associated protein
MSEKETQEVETSELEATEEIESTDSTEAGVGENKGQTPAQLEEEGDIAADYLEELLDIFDLDGDIDIDVRQGRPYVAIAADDNSNLRLISEPETVEALQELTRLAVQVKTNTFSRLILDIAGSRDAKAAELAKVVNKAIAKVQDSGEPYSLKPMSSFDRKLAHDLISEAGLVSESEGEGKARHIVISKP